MNRLLVGSRFGRLVVEKILPPMGWTAYPHAICKCDCGKETLVELGNLRSGSTKSCGCYKREFMTLNAKGRKPADPFYFIKKRYGVTAEWYEETLELQGFGCAICGSANPDPSGQKKHFCIDHDHSTGRLRGLLCDLRNKGIGHLGDDPERLVAAASYLQANKEQL